MILNIVNTSNNPLPAYETKASAGMDLRAYLPDGPITLGPMQRGLIPTGLYMEIPEGYEGQVRPRSGLALKSGITILNSPGTIDADYRGQVCVILINLSDKPFVINSGDRIAQLIIARCEQVEPVQVESLSETERGTGGFGHTGKN
jgi:dUTP pyrophosphatase